MKKAVFLICWFAVIQLAYCQSNSSSLSERIYLDSLIQQSKLSQADSFLTSIDSILSKEEVQYFITQIHKQHINTFSVSWFSFTRLGENGFSNFLPYIEYLRKFNSITLGLRYTGAGTPELNSSQIEGDIYFPISKRSYAYASMGLSIDGPFFPNYRGNFEYYLEYPKWGLVLGNRVLILQENTLDIASSQVHYTINRWQLKYRNYALFNSNKVFLNHIAIAQLFGRSNESHIQFEAHYATSPVYIGFNQFLDFTESVRFGVQAKLRVHKDLFLAPYILFDQVIGNGEQNQQITSQFVISYRF